ncbi:MAG: UDP-2,3-diacylglucosamine diphosphatase [Saprospiraceae bacterium]|nr:UDP-2,3-diacylglucosamine diphosphatase [Saprospiraceae bacterium]
MLKKTFFCSDFHFGIPAKESTKDRENLLLKWLEESAPDMDALYVLGDLFDFWFEYRQVVPKGVIRVLAALSRIQDQDIPVHLFTGNHDQWMFGYIHEELGISLYHDPIKVNKYGKNLVLGHGDGLGPGDHGYKFIKKVFRSPISRQLFGLIPPGIGIPLAKYWSGASRIKGVKENKFLGPEQEWLIQYCEAQIKVDPVDYFIFGHRHLPIDWKLSNGARYINLGDWLQYHSFATLDQDGFKYQFYQDLISKPYSNFFI